MAKLLTTSELADALGLSPATVRAYASAGRIPAELTPGGHRRFDRDEAMRALRSGPGRPPSLSALRARRDDIRRAARRHGASNVRVIGSVARGEARAGSDVDFLVDMAAGRTLFDVAALHDELEQLLDAPVDVLTSGAANDRLARIVVDAKPL